MACVTEALGLTLARRQPRSRPSTRAGRRSPERPGRQIVELVERDLKPSGHPHAQRFENAIRALHAISGSTQRDPAPDRVRRAAVGVDLPAAGSSTSLCSSTPWLVDLKPAGEHLMEDFYYAGRGCRPVLAADQRACSTSTPSR
jgi:dihydroxy-acid dehydratase